MKGCGGFFIWLNLFGLGGWVFEIEIGEEGDGWGI